MVAILVFCMKYEFRSGTIASLAALDTTHRLSISQEIDLARTYTLHLGERLRPLVTRLLRTPVTDLSAQDLDILGGDVMAVVIAVRLELIHLRQRIAAHLFPMKHDDETCSATSDPTRDACTRSWALTWFAAGRRHMSDLSQTGAALLDALRNTLVPSLGFVCQDMTCEKIESGGQLREDERVFEMGITRVMAAVENSKPCFNRAHDCWY
jgi:hypothetical protein